MKWVLSTARGVVDRDSCALRLRTMICGLVCFASGCGDVLVPRIDGFSPASGPPGTELTIVGENFDRDSQGFLTPVGGLSWQIFLGDSSAAVELVPLRITPTEIRVQIPDEAQTGRITIVDTNGIISASSVAFNVVDHPAITVFNDAQYDVVDLRVNGEQVLLDGMVIESGASATVFVTSGRFRVEYALGADRQNPWVREIIRGVEVGAAGTTTEVRLPALELVDLLTAGAPLADWVAEFRDPQDQPRTYTLRFYQDGAWVLFHGDTPADEGDIVASPWTPYAQTVQFSLTDGGTSATMPQPFVGFDLRNGPDHWPLLTYLLAE